MIDPSPYAGPLVVTLLYVALYYWFQTRLIFLKARLTREYKERGEKFDRYFGADREMLAGDRVQLNTLEHMPVFLVLLWLHAAFVDPTSATGAGVLYLVARVAYPFAMGSRMGRGPRGAILLATVPGYGAITWLLGGLVWVLVV